MEKAYGGYLYRIPPEIIQQCQQHPILSDVMVTRFGYFTNAPDHYIARPTIDEYILFYCVGGIGSLETPYGTWEVQEDQIAIVFPDEAHTYYADHDNPWTIYWAHLDGTKVADYLELARLSSEQPLQDIGAQNTLSYHFQQMADILQLGYGLHQLVWASQCLCQILSCIAYRTAYGGQTDMDIEQVIRFMRENLQRSCSLETFADYINMSPSHFSRRFRSRTGYSPIDYFIRLKIQKACELLEMSTMTVQEISYYLGYNSPYYFSRIFKKITGQSPRQYRYSEA